MDYREDLRVPKLRGFGLVLCAAVLLGVHLALSLPAISSRSTLFFFGERVAYWIAFLGVVAFSLLNDEKRRWRLGVWPFLAPALIITGASLLNVQSARPRPGNHDGLGLIFTYPLGTLRWAILSAALVIPAVWLLDRCALQFWSKRRRFVGSLAEAGMSLRAFLVMVTAISAYLAIFTAL